MFLKVTQRFENKKIIIVLLADLVRFGIETIT